MNTIYYIYRRNIIRSELKNTISMALYAQLLISLGGARIIKYPDGVYLTDTEKIDPIDKNQSRKIIAQYYRLNIFKRFKIYIKSHYLLKNYLTSYTED